jgi:hypothetical protein
MIPHLKIIVSIVLLLFTQTVFSGPFGLTKGMSLKQIDSDPIEIRPYVYVITKVPKPHSAFNEYVVQIGPKNGLCWVKGIGKVISTNSHGHSMSNAFDRLQRKLDKAYGKGEKSDLLIGASIWDKPEDFMMSLLKKDRFLWKNWDKDKGAKLKFDLDSVDLWANAINQEEGRLTVDYFYSNFGACEKEIAAEEDGAL